MTDAESPVVVGGGPAGAMAALMLGRAGIRCRLFEKSEQCTNKVCGEFLSGEAVAQLEALGFSWSESQAVRLTRARLTSLRHDVVVDLPFTAQSLPRPELDSWLLSQAEKMGAEVHRGAAVSDVTYLGAGRHSLRVGEQHFSTSALIWATGKQGLRQFHPRVRANGENLIGYKMNFTGLTSGLRKALDDTLGLCFFPGGYGGIARVGEDEVTVSLLIQADAAQHGAFRDVVLLTTLAPHSPLLDELVRCTTPRWPKALTVSNLPYGHCDSAVAATPGLFAVGDQFAVLPSFTGTGLSFAMASGALAAQHLTAAAVPEATQLYAAQAHDLARSVLRRALPLHRWLQRPGFVHVALASLSVLPAVATWIARATRLPSTPVRRAA